MVIKQECEQQYKDVSATAIQGIGTTRTNLQRLFRSIDFMGWSTHEESGRLDRRALTRFASGSANIFSRRTMAEAETSAVSVMIDCSGSMKSGNDVKRIDIAQQIAIHLSKLFQQSRVPFSVTGFRSGERSEVVNKDIYAVTERPMFIPFKRWNRSLQASIATMGAINKSAGGGTPDYTATVNAITELSARSETRKILFLLTDADGYQIKHMMHVQKLADKLGVVIVAIGIGRTDVQSCFVNAVNVHNIESLASIAFNQLLKAVERKRH